MSIMKFLSYFRGRGPLRNTMHVINAAKKISEAGAKLDKLCKQIGEQVKNNNKPHLE